jgi:hypothetical protein
LWKSCHTWTGSRSVRYIPRRPKLAANVLLPLAIPPSIDTTGTDRFSWCIIVRLDFTYASTRNMNRSHVATRKNTCTQYLWSVGTRDRLPEQQSAEQAPVCRTHSKCRENEEDCWCALVSIIGTRKTHVPEQGTGTVSVRTRHLFVGPRRNPP